jgi:hypothetical protein
MRFTAKCPAPEPEILPVPAEKVGKLWKDVCRVMRLRLWTSPEHGADYDYERLRARLLSGQDMVWLVVRTPLYIRRGPIIGIIITSITQRAPSNRQVFRRSGRSLTVHLAGGRHPEAWVEKAAATLSAWGQACGCKEVFVLARKGWQEYTGHFLDHGWDRVSFSRDQLIKHGGNRLRNRVGYFRILDPGTRKLGRT